MRAHRIVITALFSTLLVTVSMAPLEGLGKQDTSEYRDVEGRENWQKSIDLSDTDPGQYNLLVKGADSAGNIGFAGPYDVVVDPESTIPGVSISYPGSGERLGDGFSVVGVAWDDDGIERVELAIDDGEFQKVEGREYWSRYYRREEKGTGLSDGSHTIRVRSVDIDGNMSPEARVQVNVDTVGPIFTLDSLEEGSIVSGKIKIEGTVADANGIAGGMISFGNGEEDKLSLKKEKDTEMYHFSRKLDTSELEDGPQLLRFSAEDGTGSPGKYSFLLFVDNTPPEISFLYPREEKVNGRFTVVGRARDAVGIEELSFESDNGEEGSIELKPGSDIWSRGFDFRKEKSGRKTITFHLTDAAGNTVTEKLKLELDSEADLPIIFCGENLRNSETEQKDKGPLKFRGDLIFSGWAEDDDGPISRIEYAVESTDWREVPSEGSWMVRIPDVSPEEGVVRFRAVDREGVVGKELEIPYLKTHKPGKISIDSFLLEGELAEKWHSGMLFKHGQKVKLTGTVNTSFRDADLFYRIDEGDERRIPLKWNDGGSSAEFHLDLHGKEDPGRHELYLRLEGESDHSSDARLSDARSAVLRAAWFRESEVNESGSAPSLTMEEDLLSLSGESFSGSRIEGWIPEGEIDAVMLDPDTSALRVEKEGRFFSLSPIGDVILEELSVLVMEQSGEEYRFKLPGLVTDVTAPRIMLESPDPFGKVGGSIRLSGKIIDPGEVESLECYVTFPKYPNSAPRRITLPLKTTEDGKGVYRFDEEVMLNVPWKFGPVHLEVTARDRAGNTSSEYLTLLHDSEAPEFHLVVPEGVKPKNPHWAGEQVTVCGYVSEGSSLESLKLEGNPLSVEGSFFLGELNFSTFETLPESLSLEASDELGNRSEAFLPLTLNTEEWKPQVKIHVPSEGAGFVRAFALSGTALDRAGVEILEYRINDGPWNTHRGADAFSIPIPWEGLGDDENSITVRATDINGYTGDEEIVHFRVSRNEPQLVIDEPALEEVVRGEIFLRGRGEDDNGISDVRLSFDNGTTFQRASVNDEGEWSYRIDSTLLADGTGPVLFRVEDGAGIGSYSSSLLNVDNSPPEVDMSLPESGDVLFDTLHLEGRIRDAVGIDSVEVSLTPVDSDEGSDESEAAFYREYPEGGIFLMDEDISELPRGRYLFNLSAGDGAGNTTELSRSVELRPPGLLPPRMNIPLAGERVGPFFSIDGRVPEVNFMGMSPKKTGRVTLLVDGSSRSLIEVQEDGRFSTRISPDDKLEEGLHQFALRWENGDRTVESESREVLYESEGLWVSVDNVRRGDTIGDLFEIVGSSGFYQLSPESFSSEKEEKKYRKELAEKMPEKVEISFDEGKSFREVRGTEKWTYRVYRQNHPEGAVRAIVRATSGTEAVHTRMMFFVDTTPPRISVHGSPEDRRYNKTLSVSGDASDVGGLSDLKISLRPGDKNSYRTPSFIQGMYFDATAIGVTWFTTGLGMTFMEDNVKLQMQYGYTPEEYDDPETGSTRSARFGGHVIGAKLLANIVYFPYDYLLGPKFQQLSASFALGANFSYFNKPAGDSGDDWGIILAGVVGQFEFIKYEFRNRRTLQYISAFAEGQVWLISSDVQADVKVLPSIGIRVGLF